MTLNELEFCNWFQWGQNFVLHNMDRDDTDWLVLVLKKKDSILVWQTFDVSI